MDANPVVVAEPEAALPVIELYSDIHCPWAYMAVYRLRRVWPEYTGRVRIVFRALSLELKNERPTPKTVLDQEAILIARQEPDLTIWPWRAPDWRFVPTFLPAFEAVKAAEEQGEEAAWAYSWRVREAFFAESRTVCTRFALAQLAKETGLDVDRFQRDWDSGRHREAIIAESHHGWEELQVPCSPTFVLPWGEQVANPGGSQVEWNSRGEVRSVTPADCPDGDCLHLYREMLERAIAGPPGVGGD